MFFLPLFDDNPTRQRPYLSWMILAACVIVFIWQQSLPAAPGHIAVLKFGFIPSHVTGNAMLPIELSVIPAWMTVFSSMFLHGGWMHIGSNMLYLWIFGDNVEESMGRFRFLLFYAACGTAAAMAQAAIDPSSRIPMIGASGGIAGILGAYLMLHPKAAIRTFFLVLIFVRFINLPAWLVLGVWIGTQFVAVPQALTGDSGGVAYVAHIGGFIAGMVLVPLFKRSDIPLFGKNDKAPERWNSDPVSFDQIKNEARYKYQRSTSRNALGSQVGPRHHHEPSPLNGEDHKSKTDITNRRTGGSVPSTRKRLKPNKPESPWE